MKAKVVLTSGFPPLFLFRGDIPPFPEFLLLKKKAFFKKERQLLFFGNWLFWISRLAERGERGKKGNHFPIGWKFVVCRGGNASC